MRRIFLLSVVSGAICILASGNAFGAAGTITVATTNDVDASHCTLHDAITLMNTGSGTQGGCSITVATLSPYPWVIDATGVSGAITLGSNLPSVNRNVAITGPGSASLAVTGADTYSIFTINSGKSAAISGFRIAHGKAANGGGINNQGTLAVSACLISNNTATGNGGGINNAGTLSVKTSVISTNSTGITGDGGGIYTTGTLTMFNALVSANSNSGGAGSGGIAARVGGSMTLINVTVASNGSGAIAGGIAVFSPATATLLDCTVSLNTGGTGVVGGIDVSGNLTIENCIVAGNSGTNPDGKPDGGTVTSNGHNIIGDNANGWFPTGDVTDQIGVDPKLDPSGLQTNGAANGIKTIALVGSSPAINEGDNLTCQNTGSSGANGVDARGKNRRTNYCDIGAYEAQPDHLNANPSSTNTDAGRLKAPVSGDFGSLTATVQDASNNNLNGVPVAWTRSGASGPDLSPTPAGGTTPTGSGATTGQDVDTGTNNSMAGDYYYEANSTPSAASPAYFYLRNYTPAVGTASGPTQDCSGQPAQLSLQVTSLSSPAPVSTNVSIDWDDGSGSDVETAPGTFTRNVSPTNAGPSDVQHNYNVTFTDDNGAGAVTGDPVSITVHALPTANVGASSSICSGETTFPLSGSGSGTVGPYGCSWSPSTGLDNANSCTPTATPSGTTTYTLTVTDSNGCSSTNNPTVVVTVNTPPPIPAITRVGATTFCAGSSVSLSGPTGFAGYQWYKNNVSIGGASNRTYVATSTGNYTVKVTDANGCYAVSKPMAVSVLNNPVPTISAIGPTTVACGKTVKLQATIGLSSYRWYKNDSVTPIPGATTNVYIATSTGNYKVNGTNASGCSGTSADILVTVNCP